MPFLKKIYFLIFLLCLNVLYSQNISVSDDDEFLDAMLNESYTTIILENGSKKYENFDFNRSVNILCGEDTYFKGIFNFSSDNLYFENCNFEISRSNYDYIINVTKDISNLTFKNVSLLDDTTSYNNNAVFFIAKNKIENSNISINQMIKDSSETDKYTGLSFSNLDNSTIEIIETNLDEPLLLFGDFTFNDTENILENYNYIQNDNMLKTYNTIENTLLNLEDNSNIFFNENFGSSLLEIDFLQKNNLYFYSNKNNFESKIVLKNYTDLNITFENFIFENGIDFESDINTINFSNSLLDSRLDNTDGIILNSNIEIKNLILYNSNITPTNLDNDDYIFKSKNIENLIIEDSNFNGLGKSLFEEQKVQSLVCINSTFEDFENVFSLDVSGSNLEGNSNYNSFINTQNPFKITNYSEDNYYNSTLNYYDNLVGIDEAHLVSEPYCIDSSCDKIIYEVLETNNSNVTKNGTIVEVKENLVEPIYIYIEEGVNEDIYLNLNNLSDGSQTFELLNIIIIKYLENNDTLRVEIPSGTYIKFEENIDDKIINLLNYYKDENNIDDLENFGVGFEFKNDETNVSLVTKNISVQYNTSYSNLINFDLYKTYLDVSSKTLDDSDGEKISFENENNTISFNLGEFKSFYFFKEKIITTSSSSSSSSGSSKDYDIERNLEDYEKGIVIKKVYEILDLDKNDLKEINNIKEKKVKFKLEKDFNGLDEEDKILELIEDENYEIANANYLELRKTLYEVKTKRKGTYYLTKVDFDNIEVSNQFSKLFVINLEMSNLVDYINSLEGELKEFTKNSIYTINLAYSNKFSSDIRMYYYIEGDVYDKIEDTKVIVLEKESLEKDVLNFLNRNNFDTTDYENSLVNLAKEDMEEIVSNIEVVEDFKGENTENSLAANFILLATNPLISLIFFSALLSTPFVFKRRLLILKNKDFTGKFNSFMPRKKQKVNSDEKSIDDLLNDLIK